MISYRVRSFSRLFVERPDLLPHEPELATDYRKLRWNPPFWGSYSPRPLTRRGISRIQNGSFLMEKSLGSQFDAQVTHVGGKFESSRRSARI